jgi:ribosomal protein L37AE/L43A
MCSGAESKIICPVCDGSDLERRNVGQLEAQKCNSCGWSSQVPHGTQVPAFSPAAREAHHRKVAESNGTF